MSPMNVESPAKTKKTRKKIGVNKDRLFSELGASIQDNDAHAGEGDLITVSLDSVRVDPDNARKIGRVTIDQIMAHQRKTVDLSQTLAGPYLENFLDIEDLAFSIEKIGLIDPVAIYETEGQFHLTGGERRLLAHYFLGRPSIRAILKPRPIDVFAKEARALAHNLLHKRLKVAEMIKKIVDLMAKFEAAHQRPMEPVDLKAVTHLAKRSCQRYLRIARSPPPVLEAIIAGQLATHEDINYVLEREPGAPQLQCIAELTHLSSKSSITSPPPTSLSPVTALPPDHVTSMVTSVNQSLVNNALIDSALINHSEEASPLPKTPLISPQPPKRDSRGAKKKKVNLGTIQDTHWVQNIIKKMSAPQVYKVQYGEIDWADYDAVQSAWNDFIQRTKSTVTNE